MSFKGIRSRLRNPSESDQGSPSRLSFFHQLTALLSDDDQRLHEVPFNPKSVAMNLSLSVFPFFLDPEVTPK